MKLKFMVDNALSPFLAQKLRKKGYNAVHVREIGLQKATDEEIFIKALNEDRILISADTDFSYILYKWEKNKPSLILFRKGYHKPEIQIEVLTKYIPKFEKELEEGSIIVFEKERIRIKKLPLFGRSNKS